MPQLVVVVGPIGSGKSTVSAALAQRLGAESTDLDDLFFADPDAGWAVARDRQASQVGRWLGEGRDVVAHGPLHSEAERAALDCFEGFWVLLLVPYDVALERVLADDGRGLSRNPDFLRATHDAFARLQGGIPADVVYDASCATVAEIVDDLVNRLRPDRAAAGTPPAPRP